MSRCRLILIFVVLWCFTHPIKAEPATSEPVKLIIVMGGGTYESSVFRFYDMLAGVDYTLFMSDKEAFAQDFTGQYAAVLLYNLSRTLPDTHKANLKQFIENGGGLVVWHHALASYGDWPWWYEKVVGARYLLQPEGDLPASTYMQNESIVASVVDKKHPVMAGLEGHPMHIYGETYQRLWFADDIKVLLKTGLSSSDGPLVWLGPHTGERVVAIQPGHGSSEYYNLGFRHIMQDAIKWVARR